MKGSVKVLSSHGASSLRMCKNVMIGRVARKAGFSTQTVSRVVDQHPSVAPEIRLRVQRTIAWVGYQSNILARSLVQHRSYFLGVVATGLGYFGPSRTLVGIERHAGELGYSIRVSLVSRPELDGVGRVLNGPFSRQVDGGV
jgi:LacI family transcriptional regulator